jgi:hypothetical protein
MSGKGVDSELLCQGPPTGDYTRVISLLSTRDTRDKGKKMVITEDRSYVEELTVTSEVIALEHVVEVRARDSAGHCWDCRPCDHADHGGDGPVHLMR